MDVASAVTLLLNFEMHGNAATHREIERRFLFTSVPEDFVVTSESPVEQGYLVTRPVVRLRKSGEKYYLTLKRGSLEDHEEREIPLTKEQFDVLWPMTVGHRIHKLRKRIPLGDLVIELDYFYGHHEGLQIAEVEFPDWERAKTFQPPLWFGEEITGRSEYSNARLACE